MCTSVGAGTAILFSLVLLGVPLVLLPLGASWAALRRSGRGWALVAAFACAVAVVAARAMRPSADAPRIDERWTNVRATLLDPVIPVVLALAAAFWLAAAIWPNRALSRTGMAFAAASAIAVLVSAFSFPLSGDPCEALMRVTTPTP